MFLSKKWVSNSNSNSNNFIQNKKLHASVFERQIIYHQFTKVNASDVKRTGARNSAALIFLKSILNKYIFKYL